MTQYTGTTGNDSLTGSAGADVLDGGSGADTMTGLGGDDVYVVDDPGDVVVEASGAGTDRVNALISFTLPSNVEDLWLVGSAASSGTGNALDNVMWGNGAPNALNGGAGNDVLDGGTGADTLAGGAGDDTYWVNEAGDIVLESPGEGHDTVKSNLPNYALDDNLEDLVLLAGSGEIRGQGNASNNVMTGNEGNNVLSGGAGDDSLDGGAGADTLEGGAGDDSLRVDDAGDLVIESPGEGTDTVTSTLADYNLPDQVENLTLGTVYASTTPLNGSGNAADNTLRGNSGANVLSGGDGNDTLIGGSGSDTLTGGLGDDIFYVATDDSGTDTITDLSSGDLITICGSFFAGSVTPGSGATVMAGDVEVSVGAQTLLYVGLDATPGADLQIVLNGSHAADNFHPLGFNLLYDTNHAPVPTSTVSDQTCAENTPFDLHLPLGLFNDADGDALSYSLSVMDIDWGFLPLPAWLQFSPAGFELTGTPGASDLGTITLVLTATDTRGAVADLAFNLTVQAVTGGTGSGEPGSQEPAPPSIPLPPPLPGPIPTNPPPTTPSPSLPGATPPPATPAAPVVPPPTVTITDDTPGLTNRPVVYTLQFSEPVTGLSAASFDVRHGVVTAFAGSGTEFTVNVLPDRHVQGTMDLTLRAGSVFSAAGEQNATAAAAPQPVDTLMPRAMLRTDAAQLGIGDTTVLTIDLSEPSADLTASDLRVTGGTLSQFAGVGSHYTALFTPDPDRSANAVISLESNRFSDAAGNFNTDGADADNRLHIGIDTKAPAVTIFTPSSGAQNVAPAANLRVTFDEPIGLGSGRISLQTTTGDILQQWSPTSQSGLSLSGSSLTLNPTADLPKGMGLVLTFSTDAVRDLAGNAFAGALDHHFETIANELSGTAGSDRLLGTSGKDVLEGLDGNDSLEGGAGDDKLLGGLGLDVAVFSGPRAGAAVRIDADVCHVFTSADGADQLIGIERLHFRDGGLALDLDGHAGTVARVVGALLGPQSIGNTALIGIGLALADGGLDCAGLVAKVLETETFAQLAGSRSNEDFVKWVFHNLTGSAPTVTELSQFVSLLDSGIHTQASLAVLACESEVNAVHIDLVGLAATGLAFQSSGGI